MLPTTEQLLERAKTGEKLRTSDRRQCVQYLQIWQPDLSNTDMGRLFQVNEKTIRDDIKWFREQKADRLREENPGLVVADIMLALERQMRDIESSKRKATLGSRTYLEHCKAAVEIPLKVIQKLQDLGYYPKNLGTLTTQHYEWHADVEKGTGNVTVHPVGVEQFEVEEADYEEVKQLPAAESETESDE